MCDAAFCYSYTVYTNMNVWCVVRRILSGFDMNEWVAQQQQQQELKSYVVDTGRRPVELIKKIDED